MKKIQKVIRTVLLCLLCLCIPCMVSGARVSAKSKQVTYTLKNNNWCQWKGTMKGQQTMTHTLKIKESGDVSFLGFPDLKLSKKQEVRMKVIDSKGKTVISKKLAGIRNEQDEDGFEYTFCEKYLKKGTYKIVFTTKNIKKNKTFTMYFNTKLINKPIYADGKGQVFFVDNKGKTKVTFRNEKSQVVHMNAEIADYTVELEVTDKQGRVIFKESGWAEDTAASFNNHFLKKGTYYITMKTSHKEANVATLRITPNGSVTSKIQKEATSWEKAVDYKNKELYLGYFDWSGAAKKQWLRLDTSDGDKSLRVTHVSSDLRGEQNITEPKFKVSLYDHRGKLIKTAVAKGDYDFDVLVTDPITVKKDTGIYYVAIEADSSDVVRVFEK